MKVLSAFAIWTCLVSSLLSQRHSLLDPIAPDNKDYTLGYSMIKESDNDAISAAMKTLSNNFTAASDHVISQLTSVLMIKNSSSVIGGLRAKIDTFTSGLLLRLEDDLSELTKRFSSQRESGPITDDDKYQFSEMIQEKWGETLSSELATFQQSVLPRWINSVRNVWRGIERQVMDSIQKFKKMISKHLPSSSKCQHPKYGVMKGVDALESVRLGVTQKWEHVGGYALFALAIAASISLAIFAPYIWAVIGIVFVFDMATCIIVQEALLDEDEWDSEDYFDEDKNVEAKQ